MITQKNILIKVEIHIDIYHYMQLIIHVIKIRQVGSVWQLHYKCNSQTIMGLMATRFILVFSRKESQEKVEGHNGPLKYQFFLARLFLEKKQKLTLSCLLA